MASFPGDDLTFLSDSMLKKLAKYLRALGFDTAFNKFARDQELLRIIREQKRVILTRDQALYEQAPEGYGCYLNSQQTGEQLRQLAERYPITLSESRFLTRCLECNTLVVKIPKASVEEKVPPRVFEHHATFNYCPVCDRIYWHGGHVERLRDKLMQILELE